MFCRIEGGCVPVERMVMGMLENNVYLIGNDAGMAVVDPSTQPEAILRVLEGRPVAAIILTHGHWDHVGAANALREATGAPVIASAADAPIISGEQPLDPSHRPFEHCPVDIRVEEGDVVEVADMKWRVIATPGHTPGSICLLAEGEDGIDSEGAPVLVSGDTLFRGTHGRTDFEGGSPEDMAESLKRLALLPDNTIVLPGHNEPTAIAAEKAWIL